MVVAALPFPDIDPVLIDIPLGPLHLAIRWYALAYIVGLIAAWRLVVAALKRPALWRDATPPMPAPRAEDLLTWCILGVVLGGRLGFVLFYQPGHYLANPGDILKVWEGGMSFHGGVLGVLVGGVIFCLRNGVPMLPMADAMAMGTPIGLMLGRLANFINGELWGRPTTVAWAFEFPDAPCGPGWLLACTRHPSQLYEAGLEGALLAALLIWGAFRGGWLRDPGLSVGVFVAGYGLSRYVVEFFREADAQFVSVSNPMGHVIRFTDTLGVSMGQVLSLPMVAVGLGLVAWALVRRPRAA